MKIGCAIFSLFMMLDPAGFESHGASLEQAELRKVFILPIRDDIMPPLLYLVRRGVKEAIQAQADLLILDMETNGGRVDTTEELIEILGKFKGKTVTFVNRKAFSAGSFIAVATQQIYMAPQSVIGAAAPIMLAPGAGVQEMPNTMEVKMTSGISALIRAVAEKNGHNVEVVEAMINKNKELKIDGKVINEKGQILTLNNVEAEREYGSPAKPLLSAGTVENLDELVAKLGYRGARRIGIQPTGVEKLGSWINSISPLLLIIGIIGIYIEFKTPGFGLPGIVGLSAFAIYFFGGYVAGLSGAEWVAVFALGLVLFVLELLVFPGTVLLGVIGAALMLGAIIMAVVGSHPAMPGLPTSVRIRVPVQEILFNLSVAVAGSAVAAWLVSRWLPKTALYAALVSTAASGEVSLTHQEARQRRRLGEIGVTMSALHPGGKAQFGDQILDVISQGEMIPKNERVKIIGHSGAEAIVESTN